MTDMGTDFHSSPPLQRGCQPGRHQEMGVVLAEGFGEELPNQGGGHST